MKEEYKQELKQKIKENLNNIVENGHFPELGEHYSGKVRHVHFTKKEVGKPIIMVASDRVSVFDYVLEKKIPFKGMILNMLNEEAMDLTKDVIKNASLKSPHPNILIQKYCKNIMVECVVRGYVWGSLAASYEKGEKEICGIKLPDGLLRYQKLDEPLFTPTTKSEHDEPMTYEEVEEKLGKEVAEQVKEISIKLFKRAEEIALKQGLVFIDTKYEFGFDENNELLLIDEANTPDSSRYCSIEEYKKFDLIKDEMMKNNYKNVSELLKNKPELKIKELSKQFVRDVITQKGFSYGSEGKVPILDDEDVIEVTLRYIELYEIMTGKKFEFPEGNVMESLKNILKTEGYI